MSNQQVEISLDRNALKVNGDINIVDNLPSISIPRGLTDVSYPSVLHMPESIFQIRKNNPNIFFEKLEVFNREGDSVFTSASPYRNDWTGTGNDGEFLNDDTYQFSLTRANGDSGSNIKGVIRLVGNNSSGFSKPMDRGSLIIFRWRTGGRFVEVLGGGSWKSTVTIENESGETVFSETNDTVKDIGKDGQEYSNSFLIRDLELLPGKYNLVVQLQWMDANGDPSTFNFFDEIETIEVREAAVNQS